MLRKVKVSKPEAEKIVQDYLELANNSPYFNWIIKHPIYTDPEKIEKVDVLKTSSSFEGVWEKVVPDGYENKQIRMEVQPELTKDLEEVWAIPYQTNLFLETGFWPYRHIGYGSFFVDKYTGLLYISPSSYTDEFWGRDYKYCKRNQPRESNFSWQWHPLDVEKFTLEFTINGPAEFAD